MQKIFNASEANKIEELTRRYPNVQILSVPQAVTLLLLQSD